MNRQSSKLMIFEKFIRYYPPRNTNSPSTPEYRCVCGKNYQAHRSRLQLHVIKCERAQQEVRLQQFRESSHVQEPRHDGHSSTEITAQIFSGLQRQINELNAKFLSIRPEELNEIRLLELAKTYSNIFWKECSLTVQGIFEAKLQGLFQKILARQELPNRFFSEMKSKLPSLLSDLPLQKLIDDYHGQLEKAHQLLMEKKRKSLTGDRSLEGYLRGYNFWHTLPNARDYGMVLDRIQEQKPRAREQICRYYRQIVPLTSYPFPQIPTRFFTYKNVIPTSLKPKITISSIRLLASQFLRKGLKTLAVDFWFCVCLGLRRKQMLRVRLQNQSGEFYDALSLLQRKNRHYCLRPVPQSLKRLVKKYGIIYPFTNQRIAQMQGMATKLKRRFYGYRSACITELISAFSSSTFRTHHSPSITNRYYLNRQSFTFIDNFFQIDEAKAEPPVVQSGLYLHESQGGDFSELALDGNQLAIALEDLLADIDPEEEEAEQLALISKTDSTFDELHSTSQQRFIADFYERFQLQFFPTFHNSLRQALEEAIEDRKFLQLYRHYFDGTKQPKRAEVEEFLLRIYQLVPSIYDLTNQSTIVPVLLPQPLERHIFILELLNPQEEISYRTSTHELKYQKTNLRKQLLTKKALSPSATQIELVKRRPKCLFCSRQLQIKQCGQHTFFSCSIHELPHRCLSIQQSLELKNSPLLLKSTQAISITHKWKQLPYQSSSNNIQFALKGTLRTAVSAYKNYATIPNQIIETDLAHVDEQLKEMILDNRRKEGFLPLSVTKVVGKGLGVIATTAISPRSLICSYLGAVGTNENLMEGEDSQFNCGFLVSSENVQEILIISREYANVGRFINAPSQNEQANCRAEFILLPFGKEGLCTVGVVYVSRKDIVKGAELTVKYPEAFWKHRPAKRELLEDKGLATTVANTIFADSPIQFKQFIVRRTVYSGDMATISKFLDTWNGADTSLNIKKEKEAEGDESEEQDGDRVHADLANLAPDFQFEIRNYFQTATLENRFIGPFAETATLKTKYKSYSSLSHIEMVYPHVMNILGDGQCLFRTVSYLYFLLYPEQAFKFFFDSLEALPIFSSQLNSNIERVGKHLRRLFESAYQGSKDEWRRNLGRLWNGSVGIDRFICQRARQACIKELRQNFPRYEGFWSWKEIEDVTSMLEKFGHDARDPVPYALSRVFQLQINIWISYELDTQTHLVGDENLREIHILLIREHYMPCFQNVTAQEYFSSVAETARMQHTSIEKEQDNSKKRRSKKMRNENQLQMNTEQINPSLNSFGHNQLQLVPTLHPNREQWEGLETYLEMCESNYKDFGAVKIVPPFRYDPARIVIALEGKRIKRYKQTLLPLSGKAYAYQNFKVKKRHAFEDYWAQSLALDVGLNLSSIEDLEKEFWSDVETHQTEYSPDNQWSVCQLACLEWGTSQLKSFFHHVVTEKIAGINTPFTFIGRKHSMFGWHYEDYHLSALNYQLYGQPKIWYFISPGSRKRFEQLVRESNLSKYEKAYSCRQPLSHKNLLTNPYHLIKSGIRVRKCIQRENEIVITFSQAYHSGFNVGANINQAINFGGVNWLPQLSSFATCSCGLTPPLDLLSLKENIQSIDDQDIKNDPIIKKYLKSKRGPI